jgi:hypothetical protein
LVTDPHPDSFAVRPPPSRGRRSSGLFRHAIDRFLADERIGAGIEVEGDQVTRVLAAGIHGGEIAWLGSQV